MANISLAEAAKRFKVSRPTLSKALKSGRISGEQDAGGAWRIDPAEVGRLYPPRALTGKGTANLSVAHMQDGNENRRLQGEIEVLRAKLEAAERIAEARGDLIADYRRLLGSPEAPRRRWWPF